MKERSPVKKNILKLIPFIEIIAGIIFLCLEIHDYRTLYSMAEADAMYGGLADFCKYKENVFCPAFFWIIVILTGISYWKNKKLYWILTQALVFMVFFRAMFPFYAIFIELNPVVFYILPLLYSTVFFVVERKLFKIKQIDSVDITVKEPSEEPTVIETHKFDLTSADIVAKTNPGEGAGVAATSSAAGLEFMAGKAMTYVDFSKYLTDNNLDLADFTALQIAWEVQDADGKKVEDYAGAEGAPTYGKIAYVASGKLNGFDNGIDTNWTGEDDAEANTAWLSSPFTGETCTLTIAKTNPSELATVAGFNLQLQSLPANMHFVIKSITLVK